MAGVYNEQACAKEAAKEEGWESESGCLRDASGGVRDRETARGRVEVLMMGKKWGGV